jgi:PAS domain S-box-containing protein
MVYTSFDKFYLNGIPLNICVIDKQGMITFVNKEWEEFSQKPGVGEFFQMTTGQNYFKAGRKAGKTFKPVITGVQSLVQGEVSKFIQEFYYESFNNNYWYLLHAIPLNPPSEEFIIFHNDITPQKQAGNITAILGKILDNSFNEIYVFDSKTLKFIQGSMGALDNLGYSLDELKDLTPYNLFLDISDNSFKKKLKLQTQGKESLWIFETLLKRKNGSTYLGEVRLQLSHLTNPSVVIAIANDLTERNKRLNEVETLQRQLKAENLSLKNEIRSFLGDDLIGDGSAINKLKNQISLVADTDAAILIQGETGTGKEMIARLLHDSSQRKNGILVKVNCPAIPRELFESEFFGHVRGSFSGAINDRIGRFQLAHNGTIFLDEITEIPLDLQSKLLRVLQEGQFERVGESETCTVDVRVISATNRDLKKEVQAGRFREDLYYRLSVFNLFVPPLRERLEDIAPLVEYFLIKFCEKYRIPNIVLSSQDRDKLKNYSWPGNVREMKNMLERAVILCRKSELNFSQILDELLIFLDSEFPQLTESEKICITKEGELKELNKSNILKALSATNWKISGARGAAELLGVKDNTLWQRIKKLGLEKPQ